MATTAQALSASPSIHSHVVIGWPVALSELHGGPVALALDPFVGDRPLDDEDERGELAFPGAMKRRKEALAALVCEDWIVDPHLREAGHRSHHDVFDTRLGRGSDRDGVAVAPQPRRDPEDVDLPERGLALGLTSVRNGELRRHVATP